MSSHTFDVAGNRTLRALLDERSQRSPDKVFLVFEDRDDGVQEYTYAQFSQKVDRLAGGLQGLGIGRGDKVAVHLFNSPEILITWFALATLGAVMVPSNVANTASELQHVLSYSDSVAVVTQPSLLETVAEALKESRDVRHVVLARTNDTHTGTILFSELLASTGTWERPAVDSEDVVQMLFTSGTTARPKGVLLTHANALRSGERSSRSLALDTNDRCLTTLPIFHVNAQSITVLSSLTVGGTCIVLEEYRATKFWEQIRRHRATQTSIVAMQARTLLAQPAAPTDGEHHLRRVFYALAITDDEKNEFERRFNLELINGYGLSECQTLVTIAPVFGPKRWPSIGLPCYDRLVRLVDGEGKDVAIGEVGEIIVHGVPGRTLMKGYYKDPEATGRAIRDGWLYTGDNAYADERGYLYFFDRRKDMIKRAGENISSAEVEFVLNEHPAIAEAAVVGVPDPIRDEAVKAFVVPVQGVDLDAAEVQAFCAKRLASFKVPTIIEVIASLPKTSIGKVSKNLLREQSPS